MGWPEGVVWELVGGGQWLSWDIRYELKDIKSQNLVWNTLQWKSTHVDNVSTILCTTDLFWRGS